MDFSLYLPYLPHALGGVGAVWLAWVNRAALKKLVPGLPNHESKERKGPMGNEHERLCSYACMRSYLREKKATKALAALDTEVLPALLSDGNDE